MLDLSHLPERDAALWRSNLARLRPILGHQLDPNSQQTLSTAFRLVHKTLGVDGAAPDL